MKRTCKYCGAELPEGRNFCLACGKVQSAVPVTVPSPRRRLRLALPALLLAALMVCAPLLPLLQRQRPADPAEGADAAQIDPGVPGRDGGEPEDGGGQAAAPDDHPPAYGTPAEKENDGDTKSTGETASSVSPAPAYTAPAVSQPAPTPSPAPEPDEQEPWWISDPQLSSEEEMSYWLANAPAYDPALIFTPGVTYTTSADAGSSEKRILFFRPSYRGGEYLLYYGVLHYYAHGDREDDPCDPAYGMTSGNIDYHFSGTCSVSACGVSCRDVPGYGPFMHLGGNAIIVYRGGDCSEMRTAGAGLPFNGLFPEDLYPYMFTTISPEYRPGVLAAADYAVGLVT